MLLLLDNFEELVEAGTALEAFLERCPTLSALVTSRVRLGLEGERVLELPGLALPAHAGEDFERYPATALFLNIALRNERAFSLSKADKPHVLRICELLKGWPLGIELAAVWVGHMPLSEIAAEITRNLDFLESRSRNVSERHRSIRAVLDTSWSLLSPEEARVMRSLSVFTGGFKREAAAQVAGTNLVTLASLVDKSLLSVYNNGRYGRHPLVYRYTLEKLQADPAEEADARTRHAAYFTDLLAALEPDLRGVNSRDALKTLQEEIENIHAAWRHLVAVRDLHSLGRALDAVLAFYEFRGGVRDDFALFASAADTFEGAEGEAVLTVARFFDALAWSQYRLGELEEARNLGEKTLLLLLPFEPQEITAELHNTLGNIALACGDYERAQGHYEEALTIFTDKENLKRRADALSNLAEALASRGFMDRAKAAVRESIGLHERSGSQTGLVTSLSTLGAFELLSGHYAPARSLLSRSHELALELGFERVLPTILESLGQLYAALGDRKTAARHLRDALKRAQDKGEPRQIARVRLSLAALASSSDDTFSARALLHEALLSLRGSRYTPGLLSLFVRLAQVQLATGRGDDALTLLGHVLKNPQSLYRDKLEAEALIKASGFEPTRLEQLLTSGANLSLAELTERSFRELSGSATLS